ncbi:pollen-specific leucine-rich repeat extensin-like protein 1 [Zingiber officinale]|uniref:pollen-specific leucine-rich repeat extensin-like protein 1 n=1 Tax=Zingiber officinale TaxID=94328 RepID=UPI001C4C3FD5|nr:pollen-specific leucine-rich repeat extensin-like protein 1 [Zingiber officinale]
MEVVVRYWNRFFKNKSLISLFLAFLAHTPTPTPAAGFDSRRLPPPPCCHLQPPYLLAPPALPLTPPLTLPSPPPTPAACRLPPSPSPTPCCHLRLACLPAPLALPFTASPRLPPPCRHPLSYSLLPPPAVNTASPPPPVNTLAPPAQLPPPAPAPPPQHWLSLLIRDRPDRRPRLAPIKVESFYDALINEELRLEEDVIRANEAELLAAIVLLPPIEEPAPLAEVPSSLGVLEAFEAPEGPSAEILASSLPAVTSPAAAAVSSSAPLPLIELTSPSSSGKSITELSKGKRPRCKLTRAPPSKRRLILPTDELVSEGFASADLPSDEPTLAELYPSLSFPASPFSNVSASGDSLPPHPFLLPPSLLVLPPFPFFPYY